ncbi:phosphoenolpyruvate synthase [Pontixanthobacter gangjinensis]|uniref:Phosphoenolpyruvate synthase n=1 Tax=Christiangramia aestuarii TaxID=1028746 RepID=A0A7M3SWI9_9FLAO|nr:phosphoenolpyruvate synthase [Christiangramia aestuarii]MUP40970.1 phosphoenolpyruvate synthase [Christiangramia aestuarii]
MYIVDLSEVQLSDLALVGGKNASLGQMIRNLEKLGVNIPGGFALTVHAYREFIEHNNLDQEIRDIIEQMKKDDLLSLKNAGEQIRQIIRKGTWPEHIRQQIQENYKNLSQKYGHDNTDVAVRSSATAEDLPDASFAGQQETFLNVKGPEQILEAVRNCFASLFTDRAISYRNNFGFDHFEVELSVCVQKMVRSDLASSGVAFSLDTESGFRDVILINGSYGLGESVVQGTVSPDEFLVFKPTLKEGYKSIIEKKLGRKSEKMVYATEPGKLVETVEVKPGEQNQFCLSEEQVLKLAEWICIIEDYYCELKNNWCPMDIEWAVDGLTGELFIVQARPETIHSRNRDNALVEYKIDRSVQAPVRLTGIAVGDKIGQGKVKKMISLDASFEDFKKGDVLVTEMTDPDWEPVMKKASAIITNKGGRTCHAAIVAREMGVPAIVGTENGTELLQDGEDITVSCAEGDAGKAYEGLVPFETQRTELDKLDLPETPIMLNVASPDLAFKFARVPNSGIGLAREEFIINNFIQVHPLALMQHTELKDKALSEKINKLTRGFESEEDFFINRLSYGIAKIASAFYPKQAIVRLSDFKSNEYFNLLGGSYFEPKEENPMIGWRGASRYYSKEYEEAFGLECKAIKKVREEMGLTNITIMIPFCRTVEELNKVYAVMKKYGLERGREGLQVYLMAELPSNILMAEEFGEHVDGFSIGSNDLTQLTLGLDRDSSLVANIYDERNPAVKRSISNLIKAAKKTNTKVGICGQGPSDHPDFAQFLVQQGIDSISVTPDSMLKTIKAVYKIEQEMKQESVSKTRAYAEPS